MAKKKEVKEESAEVKPLEPKDDTAEFLMAKSAAGYFYYIMDLEGGLVGAFDLEELDKLMASYSKAVVEKEDVFTASLYMSKIPEIEAWRSLRELPVDDDKNQFLLYELNGVFIRIAQRFFEFCNANTNIYDDSDGHVDGWNMRASVIPSYKEDKKKKFVESLTFVLYATKIKEE
jgi:hypothetical protein